MGVGILAKRVVLELGSSTNFVYSLKPVSILLTGFSPRAPRVGLEPTTPRLTAVCSTIELSRIIWHKFFPYTFKTIYCQSI